MAGVIDHFSQWGCFLASFQWYNSFHISLSPKQPCNTVTWEPSTGKWNRTTVFHVIDLHFWRLGNGKELHRETDYSTIRLTSPFNSSQVKYFNVNEMTHRTVTKKTYLAEFFFFQSPQCRHVAAVTLPTQSRVYQRWKSLFLLHQCLLFLRLTSPYRRNHTENIHYNLKECFRTSGSCSSPNKLKGSETTW